MATAWTVLVWPTRATSRARTATGHVAAGGIERHRVHFAVVHGACDLSAGDGIPDAHRVIVACGCDAITAAVESDRPDRRLVADREQGPAGQRTAHRHCGVEADNRNRRIVSVRAERNGLDFRMADRVHQPAVVRPPD
jgi:hypothetical protein